MISLDEVLGFSAKVPGPYSKLELTKLYELAVALPDNATVVEIGVLYGRSASVFFQVAQHKPLELHFIDPWVVNGEDAYGYFHKMVNEHFLAVPFTMHNMTSVAVFHKVPEAVSFDDEVMAEFTIDLLHVDGDHSPEGIKDDCSCWLPFTERGHAVFHDYATRNEDGTLMYQQIKGTVDLYCADWEKVGVFDSQAIFRRKP